MHNSVSDAFIGLVCVIYYASNFACGLASSRSALVPTRKWRRVGKKILVTFGVDLNTLDDTRQDFANISGVAKAKFDWRKVGTWNVPLPHVNFS